MTVSQPLLFCWCKGSLSHTDSLTKLGRPFI
jgi:hypothetical protein